MQDKDLALEIKRLQRFNLMGDALGNQLRAVVSRRYTRLAVQGSLLHS